MNERKESRFWNGILIGGVVLIFAAFFAFLIAVVITM